jgi:23S rRNA (cytosine1962-C5)-methyltransferase
MTSCAGPKRKLLILRPNELSAKRAVFAAFTMSASTGDYELLDFGDGRKLERFGDIVLDRPSPATEKAQKRRPQLWADAASRFRRTKGDEGEWSSRDTLSREWNISFSLRPHVSDAVHRADLAIKFALQLLPSGQVGVFPEQQANWSWIYQSACVFAKLGRAPKILNLFAYTGGSTLAAAAAGAEVVHVDAARSIVDRARKNAELSGLADHPIRWITEDAMRFCQRELKRGNQYDAVILDPPTYGHGPKGEPWKVSQHLLQLLKLCGQLTAESRAFVVVTCHTPGIGPAELSSYLAEGIFGHCGQPPKSGELFLETSDGRRLPSGTFVRWPA